MTLTPRVVGGPLITERQVTKCSVAALICDVNVTTRAPRPASAMNRARVTSMAAMFSANRPLRPVSGVIEMSAVTWRAARQRERERAGQRRGRNGAAGRAPEELAHLKNRDHATPTLPASSCGPSDPLVRRLSSSRARS